MNNEEKAKEIAIEIEKKSAFLSGFGKEEIVIEELKNAAIEMAAWKEKQMIDKAVNWIRYYNENGGCEFDEWEDVFRKEIMEENI